MHTPEPELTSAQIDAHHSRIRRIEEANTVALPGPLLDAFLPEPLIAAGFTLREMVPSDEPILLRLKSPLIERLKSGPAAAVDLSPEAEAARWNDIWELLYLWTRPVAEARRAFGTPPSGGSTTTRDHFREIALAATADILPVSVLAEAPAIMKALAANYVRAFATVISYQAAAAEDGSLKSVPPPEQATGSAGGSTSSAASPHNSTPTRAPSPTNGHSPRSSPIAPGQSKTTPTAAPNAPAMAT